MRMWLVLACQVPNDTAGDGEPVDPEAGVREDSASDSEYCDRPDRTTWPSTLTWPDDTGVCDSGGSLFVEGQLHVRDVADLGDLGCLCEVEQDAWFDGVSGTDLTGLEHLRSTGQDLMVTGSSLDSLSGLDSVVEVRSVFIEGSTMVDLTGLSGLSTVDELSIMNSDVRDLIPPNDTMVFNMSLVTCAPEELGGDSEIGVEVSWKDAETFADEQLRKSWTFAEMSAGDTALLTKGEAIYGYAEAMKAERGQTSRVSREEALEILGEAERQNEGGVDLIEIRRVLEAL